LKFESLKNEFEKNLKEKKRKPSPSPLSFLLNRPNPSFLSAREGSQASGLFPRALAARSGPARFYRRPSTAASLFLFAPVTGRWSPAVRTSFHL
jgi:hypothetical protein